MKAIQPQISAIFCYVCIAFGRQKSISQKIRPHYCCRMTIFEEHIETTIHAKLKSSRAAYGCITVGCPMSIFWRPFNPYKNNLRSWKSSSICLWVHCSWSFYEHFLKTIWSDQVTLSHIYLWASKIEVCILLNFTLNIP